MAIDIQPDKKKSFELPSSFNALFYYSIILLVITLGAYLLVSQWSAEMEDQVTNRGEVLDRLEDDEDFQQNRDEIFDHESVINDYMSLFWERRSLNDFFIFLENSMHPASRLESINVDTNEGVISLTGDILNFDTLEQQYTIFKNFHMEREVVGWVDAENVERSGDEIEFKNPFEEVYQSPVNRQSRATIDADNSEKVIILNEIASDDYAFDGMGVSERLVDGDWYEIAAIQKIEPIKNVNLDDISEVEGGLGVTFSFNIQVDQELFKP